MPNNPLNRLAALGQSVWLDYIHRDLFASGQLKAMIAQDSLTGMTSNPAIFEKAIAQSNAYDSEILSLSGRGLDAVGIYEQLSQQDVGKAADETGDKQLGSQRRVQMRDEAAGKIDGRRPGQAVRIGARHPIGLNARSCRASR